MKDTPDKKSWYRRVQDQARNHWFATLFLISVMLMAVLHILYKIPSPCRFLAAEWTAGEALSYAGSIIGAVSTIYVLQETIHSTVKMQQEERIFSLRPYFLIKAETYDADLHCGHSLVDISNLRRGERWKGDISVVIRMQNAGAGNAILTEARLSQTEAGNAEYTFTPLPALAVGTEQLFLVKFCCQSTLAFEMLYSDAADLARYRVCCGIRIVRSGSIVSAYAGRPVTERIARSACMNFQEKDV